MPPGRRLGPGEAFAAPQLDAEIQNGDLDCDFPGLMSVGKPDGDNQGLKGQVGSRGPAIHLRTQHGDIRIGKK